MPAAPASTSCGPILSPADSDASPARPKNVAAATSVGDKGFARLQLHSLKPRSSGRDGKRGPEAIFATGADEAVDERLDGTPGHQGAELGLEQADLDPREVDHREAALQLGPAHPLDRKPKLLVHFDAAAEVIVFHGAEEDDAARDQNWQSGNGAERLPLRKAVGRKARVNRVSAVAGSRQAGFATG